MEYPSRALAMRAAMVRYLGAIIICFAACGKEHGMKGLPSSGLTVTANLVGTASAATLPSAIVIHNDQADDGQWTRPAKDYASSRYSKLAQINAANVGALRVAFTFSLGVNRGQEAAPLVVNNTMYVVTAYPNFLYALDLTKPGAPAKWTFKPSPKAAAQGVACCDVVNRGAVFADGKIILNTLDGETIAVDQNTGKSVWRTQVPNIQLGESLTMAPLVANNKVYVGVSGSEFGIRGRLTALSLSTGAVLWRAYHTGPDSDVLIGSRFKPYYAAEKGTDLGVKTWPGDAWKIGGGGGWGWVSYHPSLHLIYYGN